MKKWLTLVFVALILLLGAGYLVFTLAQSDDEEVFREYLRRVASTEHSETEETYSGEGTNIKAKAYMDSAEKKVLLNGEMVCTGKLEGADVKLNTTLQIENAIGYLRVNEISGEFPMLDGSSVQLTDMFAKAKGVWYRSPEDPTLKSQIDSGVYVFNSGIIAPGYNSTTIANALITKKALVLESVAEEGENKSMVLKSNKAAYLEVLNEVFPDLDNKQEILDNIFPLGDTESTTVTLGSNGEVLSEKSTDENLCVETLNSILGDTPEGISEEVSGVSTTKPKGTVQITPISDSKPAEELENDIVVPDSILTPEPDSQL